MAKSKALKLSDLKWLKEIEVIEDKDLTLKDIVTSEIGEDDEIPEEGIDADEEDINELWAEQSQEQEFLKIDSTEEKLEEYLRLHSHRLSSRVQTYLKQVNLGVNIPAEQWISDLGLLAFERR